MFGCRIFRYLPVLLDFRFRISGVVYHVLLDLHRDVDELHSFQFFLLIVKDSGEQFVTY